MELRTSGRTWLRFVWALGISVVLGACSAAAAQPPAEKAPAPSPTQEDAAPVSVVFPEGGFPVRKPPKDPTANTQPPAPGAAQSVPKSPAAEYDYAEGYPREVQDAPGAQYKPDGRVWSILADAYAPLDPPSQYDYVPGKGLVPIADYAPPGYEPRMIQEAPGVPEFTPIPAPLPITPEERARYVTRGIYPNSFLIPGSDTSIRLRGFVRLTGMYDFDPIGSRDDFVTNTIPVPQEDGQNFNMTARISRFALESWTPTNFNDWYVHTFIEADFFNGPGQAVGGGANPFRLRYAFADFGYFRLGQQDTVFMNGSTWPALVDFAGPRGWVNVRRPSARVTLPVADQLFWAAGVEQPFTDITTFNQGTNVQDVPDFASHLRYQTDLGHVQLGGVVRTLGYRPTGEEVTRRTGWGLSASTVFHPWAILVGSNPVRKGNPTGLERSRILLQYTFGWGIGRYIQDSAAQGLDGQVDPLTGSFDTIYNVGWLTSYEHWFTERWLGHITYSEAMVGSHGAQPGSTYAGGKYLATSLWYIPMRNMSIGAEYLHGQRENLDGQRGRANRLNALFQYNF